MTDQPRPDRYTDSSAPEVPPAGGPASVHAFIDATSGAALDSGGLTSLDRLVRSASRAGARRVLAMVPSLAEAWAALPRGAPPGVDLRLEFPWTPALAAALETLARADRLVLFAHTGLAVDPGHLEALVASAARRASPARAGVLDGMAGVAPLAPGTPAPGLGALIRAGRIESLDATSPARLTGAAVLPATDLLELLPGEAESGSLRALERLLTRLAAEGRLHAFSPARGHVSLLDGTREAAARARWGLVAAVGKASDGLVSRHLNRRISGAVTWLLLGTRVTPNALTLVSLGLGIVTALLLATGTHRDFVLGTLLYHVNSTLDGCDGELARIRFQTSRAGEWLDTICDQAGNLLFALAVPYGLWRRTGDARVLALAAFVAVGILVSLLVVAARTRRTTGSGNFNDYGRSLARGLGERSIRGRAVSLAALLLRRDAYALLFFVLALLGRDRWVLDLLAVGVLVHLLSFLLLTAGTAAGSSSPPVAPAAGDPGGDAR